MVNKSTIGATCAFLTVASFNTNAALESRLGGLAYYDSDAGLTWLADANYAKTIGYSASGEMDWVTAISWVAGLDIDGVPGPDGWRLPSTIDAGNDGQHNSPNPYQGIDSGYNITTHSEMSNMFYNVLGNTARYDTSGVPTGCNTSCLTNAGPFTNIQRGFYWSGTEFGDPINGRAWVFSMADGAQSSGPMYSTFYTWAVYSGDVSAVPVPAAVWLFGSALLGLIGLARRKARVKF